MFVWEKTNKHFNVIKVHLDMFCTMLKKSISVPGDGFYQHQFRSTLVKLFI